jgi:hypothetical protein
MMLFWLQSWAIVGLRWAQYSKVSRASLVYFFSLCVPACFLIALYGLLNLSDTYFTDEPTGDSRDNRAALNEAGSVMFSNNVLSTTADLVFIEGVLVVGLFFTPTHACCFVKEREIGTRQLLHVMGMRRTTYLIWTLVCGAGWLLVNMLVLAIGSRYILEVRVSTVPSLMPLMGVLLFVAVGHTAVASLISIPFRRPLHAQMAAVLYALTAAVLFPTVCCGNDANELARNLPDIGIEGNKSYLPAVENVLRWFPPFVGYQMLYNLAMQVLILLPFLRNPPSANAQYCSSVSPTHALLCEVRRIRCMFNPR